MPAAELARLRRLLGEATAAAEEVGDDDRAQPVGVGYFADAGSSGVADAVDAIAAHDGEIAMFVGAGVSMEAELPSWDALVRKLLIAAKAGEDRALLDVWAGTVLQEGPLAAGAVAEALYPDRALFRRALRDALYVRDASSYVPGALAGQIAWLKERLGSRLALLTVNYDGLLEAALAERGLPAASYVRGWPEPAGKAAVWHLHGRLLRGPSGRWEREGNLVLSEGSYVRSTASSFPQEFVAERLRGSLCVFVGLSMTDPNFIRWLYRSADEAGGPRFVIFVRQASTVPNPQVRQLLEQSAAARWAQYGVTPVWANYYGEVAQIVHEIGLRCNGGQPTPFHLRARRRLGCGAARVAPHTVPQFVEAQRDVSAWLRARLDDLRGICNGASPPVDLSGHHLGLALWAVDHERGQVLNWASADRAYQQPDALVASPLHVGSRWVAATAIANGVSVEQDPNVYASRWRFVRAVPVVLGPDGERSIVGAVTLTATTPLRQFSLATAFASPGLLATIDKFLSDRAGVWFTG
jgi:hypothetical protein